MLRVLILCILPVVTSRSLGRYNVDKSKISASGLSAGATMAVQFHIAFSDLIMGAAPFSGMPYGCSVIPDPCDASQIKEFIDDAYSQGLIDNPQNIRNHNVHVYHGANDDFVEFAASKTIRDTYTALAAKSVRTNFTSISGHGMPTINYGVQCNDTWMPGINRCNWWGAYHVTHFIYDDLMSPTEGMHLPGEFYKYDQSEFFGEITGHSMDPYGYVYVPSACVSGKTQCGLHLIFHGCFQGRENMEEEYANSTGYNEVGERNNIIMLYPQAISDIDVVINPTGCWDGVGFTGDDHMYKTGKQMRLVKAQIDRITG